MDNSDFKQSVDLTFSSINPPVVIKEIYCESGSIVTKDDHLLKYEYLKPSREEDSESLVEGRIKGYVKTLDYFDSKFNGLVHSVNVKVGDYIEDINTSVITLNVKCKHDLVILDCCAHCGEIIPDFKEEESLKSFSHIDSTLKITTDGAKRMAGEHITRLRSVKKLIMVIDLDQTIIQASVNPKIGEWMKDEKNVNYSSLQDIKTFTLPGSDIVYYIKFRQGLQEFLDLVNDLYELHIYTMGNRPYASAVVNLIDPNGTYFMERIISRDESGSVHKKSLERLFPGDSSMVVMLDDRPDVWDWSLQLIRVPPFEFFGSGDINAGPLDKKSNNKLKNGNASTQDETGPIIVVDKPEEEHLILKNDEVLKRIITPVVKEIHRRFYAQNSDTESNDYELDNLYGEPKNLHAGRVLGKMKSEVLAGVNLVFTGIFPTNINLENEYLWRWAREFGAKCTRELSSKTTHVIALEFKTEKAKKALSIPGIKVVHPQWLQDSLTYYNRQSETPYLIERPPDTPHLEVTFDNATRLTPTPPLDGDTSLADLDPDYVDPNTRQSYLDSDYDSNEKSNEDGQTNEEPDEVIEISSDDIVIDADKWEENMKGAFEELDEMEISSDDGEYMIEAQEEEAEEEVNGDSYLEGVDNGNNAEAYNEGMEEGDNVEVYNESMEEEENKDVEEDDEDFYDQFFTSDNNQGIDEDSRGNKRTNASNLTPSQNKLSKPDPGENEASNNGDLEKPSLGLGESSNEKDHNADLECQDENVLASVTVDIPNTEVSNVLNGSGEPVRINSQPTATNNNIQDSTNKESPPRRKKLVKKFSYELSSDSSDNGSRSSTGSSSSSSSNSDSSSSSGSNSN